MAGVAQMWKRSGAQIDGDRDGCVSDASKHAAQVGDLP
jgi:hypothetical protein